MGVHSVLLVDVKIASNMTSATILQLLEVKKVAWDKIPFKDATQKPLLDR